MADALTWLPEHPVEFSLAAGGHLSFRTAQTVEIRCIAGSLWVTREGDKRDHLLAPGECTRIGPCGKVVIGAEQQGRENCLTLTPIPQEPCRYRFRLSFLSRKIVPYY